jgi:hypothetical protein
MNDTIYSLPFPDDHHLQVRSDPYGNRVILITPYQPAWQPMREVDPTPARERHARFGMDEGRSLRTFRNDLYEVYLHEYMQGMAHLSIKRFDREAIRDWRHFQQIKNDICGPETEAVELYPAESRLADNANQYHLWVFLKPLGRGEAGAIVAGGEQYGDLLVLPRDPNFGGLALGFSSRRMVATPAEAEHYDARQRGWQEGLSGKPESIDTLKNALQIIATGAKRFPPERLAHIAQQALADYEEAANAQPD